MLNFNFLTYANCSYFSFFSFTLIIVINITNFELQIVSKLVDTPPSPSSNKALNRYMNS